MTRPRCFDLLAAVVVAASVGCAPTGADANPATSTEEAPTAAADRPNFVVVVVDDLRWDEFGAAGHPFVETPNIDRIAAEGALFTNAFHAVPLCSPNRASLLTGQYPSRHGIIDNVARNLASHRLQTYPQALQESGYRTAFIGKWHMGNDPTPRPGFDQWVGIPGQGRTADPELFENGELHVVEGYITDILSDRAIDFIEEEKDNPFLVYLSHKAVHPDVRQLDDGSASGGIGFQPAPRHRGRYFDQRFPRRANTVESFDDLRDRPAIRRALALRATGDYREDLTGFDVPRTDEENIQRRAEMLLSVDEGIGRIMERLESLDLLDETVFIFTSDNGFFYDEHGLTNERRMPYDESIRNPLLIRYPAMVRPGSRLDGLTVSVDLAPTVLELAGAPVGDHIQGRSLVPLMTGDGGWRESILVEFYTYENPFNHLVEMDYRAVRTERYKYIHWMKFPEFNELYDLADDPLETRNVISEPEMVDVRREMELELGRLSLQAMGLATP